MWKVVHVAGNLTIPGGAIAEPVAENPRIDRKVTFREFQGLGLREGKLAHASLGGLRGTLGEWVLKH
jgi:hypothetical protein